jgi:hypothetical protein
METTPHPSFLELDKVAVGAGSEATRQHAAACAECGAHVGRVRAPVPLPDWVREPERARGRPWGWGGWWGWPTAALAGSFAVALVAIGLGHRAATPSAADDAYQIKGTNPGLALYVKRGEQIETWDGKQPVRTGDLLRLQVAPEGFRHITVDGTASPGSHLYDGDLPEGIGFLPVSWRVDDQPGPEILEITLTGGSATPWHARLVLPKAH